MDFSAINLLAVLVAAIASFFIGFLWHGPLFGAQWMHLMGISKAEVVAMQKKGMGPMVPSMIAAFVQQFVMAAILAHLALSLSLTDAVQAILFAVVIWIGFIAMPMLNGVLWEKRKMDLYLFNMSYHLVTLIAMSLIVVMWR